MTINNYISERLKAKIDLTKINQQEKVSDSAEPGSLDKMTMPVIEKTEE